MLRDSSSSLPLPRQSDSGGEESRYIGLLRYVYGIDVKISTLQLSSSRQPVASIQKVKDEAVMEKLNKYLHPEGETLSPSRFNSYISCPLRFYYEVIEGAKGARGALHSPSE